MPLHIFSSPTATRSLDPPSPSFHGKQEHKQLFPLSVPAALPEMTMHRASVCVCMCVVASLCSSLMAMACRHTGQRKMDNSPNNNSRWHRQRQRQRATLSKAETETEADEDIGFALHWCCKVVSNVKGSRQNCWVSFSHIYAVFLFLVFENSKQCFQCCFFLCENSRALDANLASTIDDFTAFTLRIFLSDLCFYLLYLFLSIYILSQFLFHLF